MLSSLEILQNFSFCLPLLSYSLQKTQEPISLTLIRLIVFIFDKANRFNVYYFNISTSLPLSISIFSTSVCVHYRSKTCEVGEFLKVCTQNTLAIA